MLAAKVLYKSFYWKAFQFFISFLINIVFVRIFQSAVTAEFYSLIYLLSFAIVFFTLGLDISLNYFISKKQLSPGNASRIIITIVLLALLICLPLLYFLYQPVQYPDMSSGDFILFSFFYIAGGLLSVLSSAIFTAYDQNYLPTIVSVIVGCAVLFVSLILITVSKDTAIVRTLFVIYFISTFFQGLLLFGYSYWLYHKRQLVQAVQNIRLKKIIQFSFFAFFTNLIFFAGTRICVFIIPYWADPAAVGNYIQAFKIVEYIEVFVSFIYYPFIAIIATRNDEKTKEYVLLIVRISNTFVLIISILLLIFGRFLFPIIFGGSFTEMYSVFVWLIPGLFAACASTFFTAYYFGIGNSKYNFTSACILLLSMLILFFLLVRVFGITGAAIAFSSASLFSLIYDGIIFKRFFTYRFREVLFIRKSDLADIIKFIKQNLK